MGRLHGEGHADAESGERDHRRRPYPNEDDLPEDRRDLEELALERSDEHPVKQAQVEAALLVGKQVDLPMNWYRPRPSQRRNLGQRSATF